MTVNLALNFRHSWLGSGIELSAEHKLNDNLRIRPRTVSNGISELQSRSISQYQYGLLCAIAPTISFELETSADSTESAAADCWNNQYALILLSIVSQSDIFYTIQVAGGYQDDCRQILPVTFPHSIPYLHKSPKHISVAELEECSRLLPNFYQLIKDDRFIFAASIASNLYLQPRVTIQVASIFSAIEALLDVQQELRFRISLGVSHLLGKSAIERVEIYKSMKKLYDIRSKCVHGGRIDNQEARDCRDQSLELLRKLIVRIVNRGDMITSTQLEILLAE